MQNESKVVDIVPQFARSALAIRIMSSANKRYDIAGPLGDIFIGTIV